MAKINDNILSELQRTVMNCTMKRELLLQSAISKSKTKKGLTISSGILALFSAGTITSVIVKYFGNETLQIIAAITAALSGILSLVLTIYYAEENTTKIFEGASKYLLLRDKAYRLLIKPNNSNDKIFDDLANLQTEYAQLDEPFSKYIRYKKTFRGSFLMDRHSSQPPAILTMLNKDKIKRQNKIDAAVNTEFDNFEKELSAIKRDNNE